MFLKISMLIRQLHQKSVLFYTTVFLDKGFKFQEYACNGCHDLLMMSINLNNNAMLNNYGVDYRCIINGINRSKTELT